MEIYNFTTQCIFRAWNAFFAIISLSRKQSYDVLHAWHHLWLTAVTHFLSFLCPSTKETNMYDILSEVWICQLMHIYLNNIRAKFHLDPIQNGGALGFCAKCCPSKKNKKSTNVGSVSDPKLQKLQHSNEPSVGL